MTEHIPVVRILHIAFEYQFAITGDQQALGVVELLFRMEFIQDLLQNFEARALEGISPEKIEVARGVLKAMRANLMSTKGE